MQKYFHIFIWLFFFAFVNKASSCSTSLHLNGCCVFGLFSANRFPIDTTGVMKYSVFPPLLAHQLKELSRQPSPLDIIRKGTCVMGNQWCDSAGNDCVVCEFVYDPSENCKPMTKCSCKYCCEEKYRKYCPEGCENCVADGEGGCPENKESQEIFTGCDNPGTKGGVAGTLLGFETEFSKVEKKLRQEWHLTGQIDEDKDKSISKKEAIQYLTSLHPMMVFHDKILSLTTLNTFIQLLILKSDRYAIANSEFNPPDVCSAIDRSAQFHSLCLRSSVVKQKGFIPKHLRPPWLDSSLFEDNKLKAEEKESANGCYACYRGTKASNGTNQDEDYCACVYKNQPPNERFSKIIGTFDGLNCLQDLYKMALMPKCGNPFYDQIKHCAMVHFYENEPEKEPNGHEYKRTLALLDGCVVGGEDKNCTAKVKIEFEQPKSSFFYGNCDAQMKTVFESSFEITTTVSPFTFPVVFQHRICSSLFGSAQMENAFNGITVTISGDCGINTFKLPAIEIDKGRVHEMRGLQLAMVGQAVQWRDPRGAHLYTEQRQLTWQPTELKSISANGKVNITLQYSQISETFGYSMNLLNAIYRSCCADASSAQNTVLSPVSAAIALAMAYAGARGQTAAEFFNLLAHGDGSSLHQNNAKFIEEIESQKTFNLSIANKIFLNESFQILDDFKATLITYYQGNFARVDFKNKKEEAANKVNAFVSNTTNGKIPKMISGQSIDDQSLIFLINAIYFHAKWSQPFDQKDTGKRPFLLANGSQIQVDMMIHMNQFIYNEQNNFKLLGKEFGGGNAHLFIVLPNSNDGLTKVLEELTEAKLMEMVKNSPVTKVMVSLPKFKIESTHNLEELLPSLGLKTAFDKDNADFSGINDTVRLYISKVLQRAMISVNEQGVEAAAATMVIIATDISTAEIPPVFRANHPFAFFLVKNKKEVLFSGTFLGGE
ncbi:hypothetical protein niasHS_001919 [Heterodera schachtii]|uniref:Serpin domain-containing protein n=1 Tax=Heterodera schachtii TaxID=97005 RepID=A0ABD2KAP1_HETSC